MSEFKVEVFDRLLRRVVPELGGVRTVTAVPRHNQQPTAAFALDSDHRRIPALTAEGARVRVFYRGEYLMSGPCRLVEGTFGVEGSLTFQVQDDWRLLRRIIGWQVPTAGVGGQGTREYATYSGPAETVVKQMVAANLTRLGGRGGVPITVAPSQGRGANITVQTRMHYLADQLLPAIDQAGIGVTVRQGDAGLVVDCYEPRTWPTVLSETSGTLTAGTWSRIPPEATAVMVQGPGDGVERVYRYYVDAALEAAWGDVIEVPVDARDIKADDPNFESLMAARGAEALAAGAVKAGLSLTLSETKRFRYGGPGIHVGDRVTARLAPGLTVTDVVREAAITDSPDNGLTVTPVLGERPDPDVALVRAVAGLARGVRDLRARS